MTDRHPLVRLADRVLLAVMLVTLGVAVTIWGGVALGVLPARALDALDPLFAAGIAAALWQGASSAMGPVLRWQRLPVTRVATCGVVLAVTLHAAARIGIPAWVPVTVLAATVPALGAALLADAALAARRGTVPRMGIAALTAGGAGTLLVLGDVAVGAGTAVFLAGLASVVSGLLLGWRTHVLATREVDGLGHGDAAPPMVDEGEATGVA